MLENGFNEDDFSNQIKDLVKKEVKNFEKRFKDLK